MCEGCLEIILNNRHVVRHAALGNIKNHLKPGILQAANRHANDFIEFDDLISQILKKFFIWKKNQTNPIDVKNAFFHKIAKNAATDELGEYTQNYDDLENDPRHEEIVEKLKISHENHQKLQEIYTFCENQIEVDAIASISIGEDNESFARRHNMLPNTSTQFKRRLINKIKKRREYKKTLNEGVNHG